MEKRKLEPDVRSRHYHRWVYCCQASILPDRGQINPSTRELLQQQGVTDLNGLIPTDIFNFGALLTLRGFVFMVVGGFMVGFGTRYADGCTSGHSIYGISTLQWPSVVATCCFMAGGFITTWLLLPYLLKL